MTLDSSFAKQLRNSSERLFSFIDNFHQVKVLVVGDLTLDEFLTGQVERVSREAPVLIIRHEHTRQVPGGGANAVYNLAKLGAQVKVVGLLGDDDQGQALRRIFAAAEIDTSGIFLELHRPTVTKTRISGHARQSVTQQIVRVDRKSDDLPEESLQLQLADYIRSQVGKVDVVVCSDYGDGVFTPPVIAAALTHPLTIVDTQQNLQRFAGATLFTPNLPEAEKAVGYSISSPENLAQAGKDLLRLTQAQQILITRGEFGMSLFERNGLTASHIPAFNRTDVYDVTGAGDTVVAALTLSLCAGASIWEAAILGNLAASIVIRKFGTSTTTPGEIKSALETLLDELEQF
ncbi:bifunctional hydroxymethylpyrimidine kinase/phosphomethylpyrimidine kinase [Phormidium sp. LEGE 05292]|uniref:bifunctional heptose 7-phosphate kinase/heptose 1-phosphate adenyltransferase n=1 Tax=[Phormidium] sp. LEGE 05292 TaxID=767427 RepID=UPI001882FEFF|nr:PfkB family carbohydrate kinase [Phormidium sp. LEGE 05292]MBE9229591.1 bifunctional hydroxymethylpyrimidine kinase/phosphomethylpyrimidine kinase [Phormidium sp. LEGE 05292]